ncbi:hypothetical protein [Halorubrum sp. HHNYT27]|uniref:hypothetical protein n=1 Tax=Halorubrum sp. HHNYT27 TaxID=3402275 RepID=UPI003EBB2C29
MVLEPARKGEELTVTVRRLGGGGLILLVVGAILVSLPIFLLPLVGIVLIGAGLLLLAVGASVYRAGRPTPPRAVGIAAAVWLVGTIGLFVSTGRPRPLVPAGALAITLLGYPLGVSLREQQWAWAVGTVVLAVVAAGVTVVLRNNPYPMSDLFGVIVLGGLPGLVLVVLGWWLSR